IYKYHKLLEENNLNIALILLDELCLSNDNFNTLLKISESKYTDAENKIKILENKRNENKKELELIKERHMQEIKQLQDKLDKVRENQNERLINQLNNFEKTTKINKNSNNINNTFNGDVCFILGNFDSQAEHINKTKEELSKLFS